MSTNRRDFIKFVVAGAVAAGCPVDLSLLAEAREARPTVDSESNTVCHQVRDGHQFSLPPVSRRHDVVIAGGGISGMTSAYLLPDHDWLLLEKELHLGGNAYEMDYKGNVYGTGAAFVESPAAADLANELGLRPLAISNWDGTIINGKFVADTWGDGIDHLPYPAPVRDSFKKFKKEMLAIDLKGRMRELDNVPLSRFLSEYPPELKQWWDAYGPSNWGTLSEETSSLIAITEMQAIAGETRKDDRTTWPGGLGALSARLAEKLKSRTSERMLTGATLVSVRPEGKEVKVTYIHGGRLTTVAARSVIMATPKFITARLVAGLPPEQATAMHKIRYAPYPVVNLIYDRPVFNKGYDNWCPGNTFTDFIVADWTIRNRAGYQQKYNILTCYTPMRESQRPTLLTDQGARQVAENVLRDFKKLLPATNRDPLEVHIYRRGHPMYMCTPGNYTQTLPLARQPMERVFFANTDSEGPVSTTSTAIQAAHRAVKEFKKAMAGKVVHGTAAGAAVAGT
jgi:protoporphyrinogen oxidase